MKGLKTIVENDNSTVIIGSNTTVVVQEEFVAVITNGKTTMMSRELYDVLEEVFEEKEEAKV